MICSKIANNLSVEMICSPVEIPISLDSPTIGIPIEGETVQQCSENVMSAKVRKNKVSMEGEEGKR